MLGEDRPPVLATFNLNPGSASHVVALVGFALIGIGTFLPWVGETALKVYVLGMESGFERQWGKRLLIGAVLGAVLLLVSLRRHGWLAIVWSILAVIGVGTVLIAIYTTPLAGRWPPEIGVYVTLTGGLFVTGASIASLVGIRVHRPEAGL